MELSQVLNDLNKQHKDRHISLLIYRHCPCYKAFVHSITSLGFDYMLPDANLVEILMKDNVWRTSVYMQFASLSGSHFVNILNF